MAASAAAGHAIYLGRGRKGPVHAAPEDAVLVLGPPRSGKTTTLVVPNVVSATGPVVSTSTKTDVLLSTVGSRRLVGKCWLFDPTGNVSTAEGALRLRWSPVVGSADWDQALLTARAMATATGAGAGMLNQSHWEERAQSLLAPLLHAADLAGRGMDDVMGWVNRREAGAAQETLEHAPSPLPGDLLEGVLATQSRELSSIWSTAGGLLTAYRGREALSAAREPNFDPAALVASSDTVYVVGPSRDQALVAPIVSAFIEQLRSAAYRAHDRHERAGHAGPEDHGGQEEQDGAGAQSRPAPGPLLLALDEVANIAPLRELPSIVSEGGSQGVLTLACLQDLSQARARWPVAADGFWSLFGTKVVLPGIGDIQTLRAVATMAGMADERVTSETRASRPLLGRRSITVSPRRRPRLEPDEVSHGRPGTAVVMSRGEPPRRIELTPAYASELFAPLVGERARGLRSGPRAPSVVDRSIGGRGVNGRRDHDRGIA